MVMPPFSKHKTLAVARLALIAAVLSFVAGAITPFSVAAQQGGVSGAFEHDGWTDFAIFFLLILALLVFCILLWKVLIGRKKSKLAHKRQRGNNSSLHQRMPGSHSEDSGQATGGFGSAAPSDLNHKISMLGSKVDQLYDRIESIEQDLLTLIEKDGNSLNVQQMHGGSSLNRRRERIRLPENGEPGYRATPNLQRHPEKRVPAVPSPPPATPEQTAASVENFVSEVAARFNDAGKPAEHDALALEYHAEYYSNERKSDIATLIKSDTDRFWLIPIPGDSTVAALIPGFAIKKSWQRYRQDTSDHPLAHHFKLIRGDKFVVHAAAIVSKDSSGQWKLERPGEVSMLS